MTQNWKVWVVLYEKGISFSLLHPLDPALSVRVEMRAGAETVGPHLHIYTSGAKEQRSTVLRIDILVCFKV